MARRKTRKTSSRRTIRVEGLARVEGEGKLLIRTAGGRISDLKLRIFEPPRFFEALLRGRGFEEAPDITSRICGICPVAYQLCAVQAMEAACGFEADPPIRLLRRLFACGEWIESHALHVCFLHAPDFLGYDDAFRMAKDHPQAVAWGLALKKAGNAVIALLGGRSVHPISLRVGGFYKTPSRAELSPLAEVLSRAREAATKLVSWTAGFSFPRLERDYLFVGLRHSRDYPLNEGRIVSSAGLDIDATEFEARFVEDQADYSTALRSRDRDGRPYLVGPLARYNLNFDRLSPLSRDAAREAGLDPVCMNPLQAIVIRAVEILYACDEALRLIEAYEPPDTPARTVSPRAAEGVGCVEAPRGLLYHRYRIDDAGAILRANIVPPTAQNQLSIEADLRAFAPRWLRRSKSELTRRCEQVVRNHDPCISCATHFLRVEVEGEE